MKITYIDNMGELPIHKLLNSNSSFYYRTLSFNFDSLDADGFDAYIPFLDEKIDLAYIIPNEEAFVMIRHSSENIFMDKRAEHLITLLASRILTCSHLKWSYVADVNIEKGKCKVEIILPTSNSKVNINEILKSISQNKLITQHE